MNKKRTSEERLEFSPKEIALLCARVAAAHKAQDPVILEVAGIVSFADYFVICSGRSTRHVQAIAEHLDRALHERRLKHMGIEGLREGHWVLLDIGDVIIHIFYQPVRKFYDLEGLWAEAGRIELSEPGKNTGEETLIHSESNQ